MSQAWQQLTEELDLWHDAGLTATFWWRDDDAVEPTLELERLLTLAKGIPLALAVIPGLVVAELAEHLRWDESICVLQHGWRHASYALKSPSEYPRTRSSAEVELEIKSGRDRLLALFESQALPVLVPPWHAFATRFLPILPRAGITAISLKGPRILTFPTSGLFQANVHMSPLDWSDPPSFGDEDVYLSEIVSHLRLRRKQHGTIPEVTGLLTHHLAQDDRSYAFLARLIELITIHPATAWLDAREVFMAPHKTLDRPCLAGA